MVYNEQITGGKWRHMISPTRRNRPPLRKPDANALPPKADARSDSGAIANGYISLEASSPRALSAVKERSGKSSQGVASFRRFHRAPAHDDCSGTGSVGIRFQVAPSWCCQSAGLLLPTHPIHRA